MNNKKFSKEPKASSGLHDIQMEIMSKINDEKKTIEENKFRIKFNEELDLFLNHLEKKH